MREGEPGREREGNHWRDLFKRHGELAEQKKGKGVEHPVTDTGGGKTWRSQGPDCGRLCKVT